MGISAILYSFYAAGHMYGELDEFQQQSQVNCSSYVYYCLFEIFAIVSNQILIEIGLVVFLYLWLKHDFHEG